MRLGRWLRGKWGSAAVLRGRPLRGGRACSFSRGPWLARRPGRWSWQRRHLDAAYLSEMHIPTGLSTWLSGRVPRAGEL